MRRLIGLLLAVCLCVGPALAGQPEARFWVLNDFSRGLNSHISEINTPDNQAAQADNIRFNDKYGAFSKREILQTAWDAGSTAITGLHRYYKSDGTVKTLIATSTYLDVGDVSATTVTHIASGLSDGRRMTFTTYKDIAIGTNGYDQPIKYDGKITTTANTDGARTAGELCAELGAPFAELNTGANLTAARYYQYKMMFLVSGVTYYSNARSNPILTGSTVRDITLTDIPIGPVGTTARYIYRIVGNATQAGAEADTSYYLAATISNNIDTTANDTVTDAALVGYTAWDTSGKYNCTPPKGKFCNIHAERLWIAGNTTYKSDVYFSDDGNPDFFDPDDYDVVRVDDGDEITFITTFLGVLHVGKNNTIVKYYTDGSTVSGWYQSDPFSFIGCPAPYSVAVSPMGIIYLGRHGLYLFTGQESRLISDAVTPDIEDISQVDIAKCAGIYHNNEYRLSYTSTKSGEYLNNRVLIYNTVRDSYSKDILNINCWAAFNAGTDLGTLYSGSSDTTGIVNAHSYTVPSVINRYKSEFDAGTYDDMRATGTETNPELELAWDCNITGWQTELQTKDANITTIADIETYLPNATISRPDKDGSWTSPVFQVNATTYDKLYWNEDRGTGGDVTMNVRSNSTASMTGVSWSSNFTDPTGSDLSSETANAFVQFRTNFSTDSEEFSPTMYLSDGYVFKMLYSKAGSINETSVASVYRTGWKNFGVQGYQKQIARIRVYYTGTSGTISLNVKGDEGDIDKTVTIDLSVSPSASTTDDYTGSDEMKIFSFLPPVNSDTEPSMIAEEFMFTITETGIEEWTIDKIEVQYYVNKLLN